MILGVTPVELRAFDDVNQLDAFLGEFLLTQQADNCFSVFENSREKQTTET